MLNLPDTSSMRRRSDKRLHILGAGGHGKVAADCAEAIASWREIVFFDARWPETRVSGRWPVVGTADDLFGNASSDADVFVAIGDGRLRLNFLRRLIEAGHDCATIIHPRACVSSDVAVGPGSLVAPGAIINIGARLGVGCIVNTGATVDHDCSLADGVHICPGAHLAGDVAVGQEGWIGIGASVRQGIRIGARVVVGAGAAVVSDVADGVVVVGVPAKPSRTKD